MTPSSSFAFTVLAYGKSRRLGDGEPIHVGAEHHRWSRSVAGDTDHTCLTDIAAHLISQPLDVVAGRRFFTAAARRSAGMCTAVWCHDPAPGGVSLRLASRLGVQEASRRRRGLFTHSAARSKSRVLPPKHSRSTPVQERPIRPVPRARTLHGQLVGARRFRRDAGQSPARGRKQHAPHPRAVSKLLV